MSAIFGIIDWQGRSISDEWKLSMQADLAHRGPDGIAYYEEPGVLMCHLLLKVTAASENELEPYSVGDLIIVANARLDARKALIESLQLNIAGGQQITDTILLLHAYLVWGENFVKNIYGDFSFAIWDKKKKTLFCGRDAIGVKPLFYYFAGGRFVFSTELKAIVNLPFVKTSLNHHYLRNRAIAICDQPEDCSWTNIKRIQPAHTLLLKENKLQLSKYWEPSYKRNSAFKTAAQSAAAVRHLLEQITADHTTVKGTVGAFLSGGLDSGTVSCLAARQLEKEGKNLVTASSIYTPGLSDPNYPDEMEYIEAVLQERANTIPTFVHHTDHSFLKNLDTKLKRNYAPVNLFHYVDEALYNQFQRAGVRRVLSGYLGDLTVTNSGINPFAMLLGSGRFRALYRLLGEYQAAAPQQTNTAILKNSLLNELLPTKFRKWWKSLKASSLDVSRPVADLPLSLSGSELEELQTKVDNTFRFPNRSANDILHHVWPDTIYLFDEEEDCAASYHQLEVTYPLCDRRLIELVLQLPPEHFYAGGRKRGLIRAAMAGILPEKVRTRITKGNYSPAYPALIQKEINQIIEIVDTACRESSFSGLVDCLKFGSSLKDLSESNLEDSFTYINWTLIEIFVWLHCTKSIEKVKGT